MEKNAILERWEIVLLERKSRAAVFSPDGEVLRTYGGIAEEAARWTDRLGSHSPRGSIGLQMGNDPSWPAILLAAWKLGCPAVPLDGDLTGERRSRLEKLCGISLRIERGGGKIVSLESPPAPRPASTPQFLKLTSGTMGEARAIRFTANQLLADCDTVCETMGIRTGDLNYGVISFAHSYGFSNLITPLLCRGVPVVVAEDRLPLAIATGLGKTRATVLPGVPAIFRALGGSQPGALSLRLCISAGAPLSTEVGQSFFRSWERKIHSFYGASECGGICYDDSDDPAPPQGFVGRAMQNVEIKRLSKSQPAQIEVRSGAVASGYLPEVPGDVFGGGTFRPADLLEENGAGYTIKGRLSETINVAGRKVDPHEIENILLGCPGVREVVVLGLPAVARGEDVAACVAGDVSEEALRIHCANALPPWQSPRRWLIVDSLPVNARGKTSRESLRALF
jgi:acyl-CoA synthetase (AMP-forming)/AMP-acid ligase II